MTTQDGKVLGTTTILDNGPPSSRFNLVIMGDGYQETQMKQYANDVQRVVNTMFGIWPFDALRRAINVYRVDVASTDSGADDPKCGGAEHGTGATARTYFDATFCGDNQTRRLLVVNDETALATADAQVPQWGAVLVAVNSTVWGGSGGSVGTFSHAAGAEEIAIHEMGHTVFGLADEYEYLQGCDSGETGHDKAPTAEPAEANVTVNTDWKTLKWAHFVAPSTPMPTTRNRDCTKCDPRVTSPVPPGMVGLFEGARYFHCGAFRPEFNCQMRSSNSKNPFCAVCSERIWTVLKPYLKFVSVYQNEDDPSRRGIGGYDLAVPTDRAFAFDFAGTGRLDHLVLYRSGSGTIWILRHDGGVKFTPVYRNENDPSGVGIGGYDLKSSAAADRAFAFDYDGTGRLDHLVLYRPGTGAIFIVRHDGGTKFTHVYNEGDPGGQGIGGYKLTDPADRAFAFDFVGYGRLDHLVLYGPGSPDGRIWILRHDDGATFTPVYTNEDDPGGRGIGGYDLTDAADRVFAFDFDGTGRLDHLVLYRPGSPDGRIWILRHDGRATFTPVYRNDRDDPSGVGIGGYDLTDAADRVFAFDYNRTGNLDHLVLYRPGSGRIWILRHDGGATFTPVYPEESEGIGGYDLAVPTDEAFAFDFAGTGTLDHLVLYRPGKGKICILDSS